MKLDRDSDVPVGVQLAWHLRAQIARLEPGDRLPGVRDLAATTKVNVNTVRSVYARLEAEGLVSTEHGRGTFVSDAAGADRRLAGIVERAAHEARAAGLDPREVAAALYVNREDDAQARRRALRDEIAALERRLADERLQRVHGAASEGTEPVEARGVPGGRILTVDELRTLRDGLAQRVMALEDADRASAMAAREQRLEPDEPARTTPTSHAAGPVRWTLRPES